MNFFRMKMLRLFKLSVTLPTGYAKGNVSIQLCILLLTRIPFSLIQQQFVRKFSLLGRQLLFHTQLGTIIRLQIGIFKELISKTGILLCALICQYPHSIASRLRSV